VIERKREEKERHIVVVIGRRREMDRERGKSELR
jgi:hypothetical protein